MYHTSHTTTVDAVVDADTPTTSTDWWCWVEFWLSLTHKYYTVFIISIFSHRANLMNSCVFSKPWDNKINNKWKTLIWICSTINSSLKQLLIFQNRIARHCQASRKKCYIEYNTNEWNNVNNWLRSLRNNRKRPTVKTLSNLSANTLDHFAYTWKVNVSSNKQDWWHLINMPHLHQVYWNQRITK